jgi:RNA polymerase sigma-70 factor (ECF subfamily)
MRGHPTLTFSARTASVSELAPEEEAVDIAALYRAHARTVARWAARLGGPGIDVEDVVHEVFLIARRRLRSFKGDAKITTWLFRATEKVALTARRKQRLRRWLSRASEGERPGMGDAQPTPSEALERRQTAAGVYRVLDRLPEKQRRILILFELEGLSTAEIAELTGARLATVRVWLHRARAKFIEEYQAAADRAERRHR